MNRTTTQMLKGITILILILNIYMIYPIFDTSLVAGYDLKVGDFCELSMALFAVLLGYEYDSLKEKNIQYGMKRTYGQAGVAAGVVLPYILFALVKLLPNYETSYVLRDLDQCFLYFPCIVVGDLLAGYQVFEKADQRIHCRMFLAVSGNCQKEF